MTRRIVLILLATVALNTAIAAMLVANSPERHDWWPTFVQSQAIGLTIAALCWAVVPRVTRSEGDLKVAVPLFGAAIIGGALIGIQLAALATRALFGEPTSRR
jgi:cytochrome bd-type quinol oxidase subunit 2